MKDKFYKAEENMKGAFDSYEAPMDNKAFEAFKDSLDNSETNSSYWLVGLLKATAKKRFGYMLVMLTLAAIFYKLGFDHDKIGTQELSRTDYIDNTISVHTDNSDLAEVMDVDGLRIEDQEGSSVEETTISTDITRDAVVKTGKEFTPSKNQNIKKSDLDPGNLVYQGNTSRPYTNDTNSTSNNNNEIRNIKSEVDGRIVFNPVINPSDHNIVSGENISLIESNRSEIQFLEGLNGIDIHTLVTERGVPKVGDVKVNPWKEKYNSHFYVGIDAGFAKELNHSTIDNYFQKLSFLEIEKPGYHIRVKGGYQFSRYSAIELNVHMKDNYLEWDLSNGLYSPYDTKVQNIPIVGIRFLNTIPLGRKLELNTSLGYAMGFNISYFESSNPGFVIEPGINQTEQILVNFSEFKGTSSRSYSLLEAGIGSSYHITNQISVTGSLNYFFGSETILSNRIEYIAGEGNPGDFEITSKGGFYALDIGLTYRFRDMKD